MVPVPQRPLPMTIDSTYRAGEWLEAKQDTTFDEIAQIEAGARSRQCNDLGVCPSGSGQGRALQGPFDQIDAPTSQITDDVTQ
jgi:hypothetical protein